ncbi:MAG TPA: transglycosylase SLT domain-containing protein, partial [Patescibacteria group bacterium]|nr:transglycosylase SLT domain-containing protein [Patescibacteria group bacterium]
RRAEAEKQLLRVILEPANNIKLGARVLDCYLSEAGGDLDAALARYSGGATNYASKVKRAHQAILTSLE